VSEEGVDSVNELVNEVVKEETNEVASEVEETAAIVS
jgi:hypothetical protein